MGKRHRLHEVQEVHFVTIHGLVNKYQLDRKYFSLLLKFPFQYYSLVTCFCIENIQFNYNSGQPAPEFITDKIYANTLTVFSNLYLSLFLMPLYQVYRLVNSMKVAAVRLFSVFKVSLLTTTSHDL